MSELAVLTIGVADAATAGTIARGLGRGLVDRARNAPTRGVYRWKDTIDEADEHRLVRKGGATAR